MAESWGKKQNECFSIFQCFEGIIWSGLDFWNPLSKHHVYNEKPWLLIGGAQIHVSVRKGPEILYQKHSGYDTEPVNCMSVPPLPYPWRKGGMVDALLEYHCLASTLDSNNKLQPRCVESETESEKRGFNAM